MVATYRPGTRAAYHVENKDQTMQTEKKLMPLHAAAKLVAAAHSGSQGARKRLHVVLCSAAQLAVWPNGTRAVNKTEAGKFVRELSGETLKASTEAVNVAIDTYDVRSRWARGGDVLGHVTPGGAQLLAHSRRSGPWESAVRVARRLQASSGLLDELGSLADGYSGETRHVVTLGVTTSASTETSRGETYSRGCTYRKTDATHRIEQTPQAVLRLSRAVAAGLPVVTAAMIHLDAVPVGEGRYRVTVAKRGKGKTIASERGLLVQRMAEGDWFHAATERAIVAEVRRRAKQADGHERVKALFQRRTISIAACRRLGWCEPGIRSWVARWIPGAEQYLEARKAPRAVVRDAAERAAAVGDSYGAKLLALVA